MSVIYCNKTIIIIIIIINARWNDYFNIYIILQRSSLKTSDTEKVTSSWELLEGFVAVQYNFLLIFTTNSAACQRTKRPEIAWARFFCWEFNCFCAAPRSTAATLWWKLKRILLNFCAFWANQFITVCIHKYTFCRIGWSPQKKNSVPRNLLRLPGAAATCLRNCGDLSHVTNTVKWLVGRRRNNNLFLACIVVRLG